MNSYIKLVESELTIILDKSIKSKQPSKEQYERWLWSGEECLEWTSGPFKGCLASAPLCDCFYWGIFHHGGLVRWKHRPGGMTLPFGFSFPSRLWSLKTMWVVWVVGTEHCGLRSGCCNVVLFRTPWVLGLRPTVKSVSPGYSSDYSLLCPREPESILKFLLKRVFNFIKQII